MRSEKCWRNRKILNMSKNVDEIMKKCRNGKKNDWKNVEINMEKNRKLSKNCDILRQDGKTLNEFRKNVKKLLKGQKMLKKRVG